MEISKKHIGIFLITTGILVLFMLLFKLEPYLLEFSSNPIYEFIVGSEEEMRQIAIANNGDQVTIELPLGFLRIVALFFGFMFLRIWLDIGSKLISVGRELMTDDVKNLEKLLDKLLQFKNRTPSS
ncbi:hypothetical protein [Roseofilum capinflatum]|uniref:Uncharacterized protein n=1 Tax=Roseofilum capinflatum BLCC-M114 TaxID=3022440 RepID=A0ABT7BA99_9CYAN|nr:hypothetical protein [Roseofilum capinflatum]MDJ1176118.1 hypothetical protein [Roseofilum capinflatum BLCC-M114]